MKVPEDFPLALQMLRIARGWTQDELAKESGLRGGTISDYERGKMAPGQKTLQKLLAATGYSMASLDDAQRFVRRRREEILGPIEDLGAEVWGTAKDAALQREIEEVAFEAGKAVARIVRLMSLLLLRDTAADTREHSADSHNRETGERAEEAA